MELELRKRIKWIVENMQYSEQTCRKREENAIDSYFKGLDRGYADAYAICRELLIQALEITEECIQ